ncbi:MAG: o-succinylbenzoate synthase [Flavobacteriales bacterium]|nr:o-succinylbenzoate synthase [Flavobacteriales bacterium]
MIYSISKHILTFKKPAKTSRNTFLEREIYLVKFEENGLKGIGEAAPLAKLSIDDVENYEEMLHHFCQQICEGGQLQELDLERFPSIKFGLETALLNLKQQQANKIFDCSFFAGKPIKINGLVWMNELEAMYDEALQKIESGFSCIKFKVGTHDFDAECRLLEKIRKQFSTSKVEIRLDANGAFLVDEALIQLKELAKFDIHSLEQPIKKSSEPEWDSLAKICHESAIDIALDEELIGLNINIYGEKLINQTKPKYLILKPNLIGGFDAADHWVKLAKKHEIDWWATSALESNVGLNAIAQWVSQYDTKMPQGLGTGSLYENNIAMPLQIVSEFLRYNV